MQTYVSFHRFSDIIENQQKIMMQYAHLEQVDKERIRQNTIEAAEINKISDKILEIENRCVELWSEHVKAR